MKKSKKILIVDDEPAIRGVLTQFLRQEGYECIATENGTDALDILETESIPVVLLDMLMPGLDGIPLLQEVKKKKPLTGLWQRPPKQVWPNQ